MKACIYARTSRREKLHTTTKIERQVEFCLELARLHHLTVEARDIYTDVELTGDLQPSCWVFGDEDSRPALSGLIEAVEKGRVSRVIVRRIEKLGTTSDVLTALLDLFQSHGVKVVVAEDIARDESNPTTIFALQVLAPCMQFDTDAERDRRERVRAQKREEIARLQDKLSRLEAELAEL